MKTLFKYTLIAILSLLTASSCEFDHLHYQTNLLALVRIDIDWTKSHITPNGVSAYVYDSNGDLHSKELSSNPRTLYLKLPSGSYSVVLHNNSIEEISGVELKGMSKLETASIYATKRNEKPPFSVVGDEMLYINEPGDIVSCTLHNIDVTESDIKYHYYKPNLSDYEQECTYIYKAMPLPIVHLSRVIAHIDGLEYAAGAPTAILRGMSGGYNLGLETTSDKGVMEVFKVNTRVTKKVIANSDEGDTETIYVDYNTFGMHAIEPNNQQYFLDIRFNLIDGSTKDYHVNVTNSIRTETTKTQNIHIIEVKLESLPNVSGGDNGDSYEDGTFNPSLDDWIDVEVELPM